MTNDNHPAINKLHSKKEMKRAVADKLQTALPEMKTTLGEKKFDRRLKKAVKMLMQGIHSTDVLKKARKKADTNRAASIKKGAAKKTKTAQKAKKAKAALPEMF
jgi:hypothetical protein